MANLDVEFHYGLGPGAPFLIGGASFEEVSRVAAEATALDATTEPDSTERHSAGTQHFYNSLGQLAGVTPQTDAALRHYADLVEQDRQVFITQLEDE